MSGDRMRIARDTEVLTSFVRVVDAGAEGDDKTYDKSNYLVQQQQQQLLQQQQHIHQQQLQHQEKYGVWQLSKELKLKNSKASRRSRRYEECYTDKDRAAAVNMGSRDIKQSLKMKRKQERSKALHLPEETEPGALLALAGYEMTARRTNIALSFINKALNLNPEDKNALVARSKCYLLLGEAKHALEDAESALALDSTFIKGLFRKAEALYHLGNFEHSLMYFHRGLRMRPDMEGFRLGVQKAQQAIENVIGHCRTGVLASSDELVSLMKCAKNVDDLYRVANVEISALAALKNKVPQSKELLKKKAERHLLGELYADKVYLEDLLTKKMDIINLKNDFANSDVAQQAREGIEFLTTRQDFWRQQKPKGSIPLKKKRLPKQKLEINKI